MYIRRPPPRQLPKSTTKKRRKRKSFDALGAQRGPPPLRGFASQGCTDSIAEARLLGCMSNRIQQKRNEMVFSLCGLVMNEPDAERGWGCCCGVGRGRNEGSEK